MLENNISSINCSGLDFFEGAVDFDDLAFLNMVLSMQQSDQALAAKMDRIRELNKQKTELTEKIHRLNDCIERSGAKKDNHSVLVPVDLDNPGDPNEVEHYDDIVLIRHANTMAAESAANNADCKFYSKLEVENEIEKLRDELEALNTESSVAMIDLQRLMNKRNEVAQLTSNITAKCHQTAMAIISNFK